MTVLRPSATLAMNERCAALVKAGHEVYRLGFGQSPFPVPPSVVAALQANAHQKDYLPVRGLGGLREAVAAFHRRRHGLPVDADDVLIGPGSKELIFLAQMIYQGELLVPAPSWVSYEPQARLARQRVTWLPTDGADGWRLRADTLALACAEHAGHAGRRVLILNSPNNPTGLSLGDDALAALAAVARDHHILVVSDEIYGDLHHVGAHVSMARHYPEGTLITAGLSKWCGAGGWRLGTMVVPPQLRWLGDAMAAAASETFSTVAAPVQHAAVTAFTGNAEIERFVSQSRRILRALGRWTAHALRDAGIAVDLPQGAFYLFPDFTPHAEGLRARGIDGSDALCERLLADTGVALLSGSAFGCAPEQLTARLAYVDFGGAEALQAVGRVPEAEELDTPWLRAHCGRVLAAGEAIVDWLRT
jgi:aspartate aminotransferase